MGYRVYKAILLSKMYSKSNFDAEVAFFKASKIVIKPS
jgi:hypothetical protein